MLTGVSETLVKHTEKENYYQKGNYFDFLLINYKNFNAIINI